MLELDDVRISIAHARLVWSAEAWAIEDTGSKNGLLVNGSPVKRAVLADRDVIEIGDTVLVFRDHHAVHPECAIGADVLPVALGLPTLHGQLARSLQVLALAARSNLPVVVLGETGTGKEVVAREIHAASGRPGPLVAINCGAMSDNLLASELFGYKRGAFSGALEDRLGMIRAADGGTLLLDEIGDLPARSQVALLRVLQEREVLPVGATCPIPVDVRLIAATHRDLARLVVRGEFRADLYARLAGVQITLPPLRERREDLGLLIQRLVARLAPGRPVVFTGKAVRALFKHDWPLNVRELEKCLAFALVMASSDKVDLQHLPESVLGRGSATPGLDLAPAPAAGPPVTPDASSEALVEVERRHVLLVLEQAGWQKRRAADILGISRPTLDRKIKRLDIAGESAHAARARAARWRAGRPNPRS